MEHKQTIVEKKFSICYFLKVGKFIWYIYTMEFYAAERKKELIPFATAWMELESIMLSEKRLFYVRK